MDLGPVERLHLRLQAWGVPRVCAHDGTLVAFERDAGPIVRGGGRDGGTVALADESRLVPARLASMLALSGERDVIVQTTRRSRHLFGDLGNALRLAGFHLVGLHDLPPDVGHAAIRGTALMLAHLHRCAPGEGLHLSFHADGRGVRGLRLARSDLERWAEEGAWCVPYASGVLRGLVATIAGSCPAPPAEAEGRQPRLFRPRAAPRVTGEHALDVLRRSADACFHYVADDGEGSVWEVFVVREVAAFALATGRTARDFRLRPPHDGEVVRALLRLLDGAWRVPRDLAALSRPAPDGGRPRMVGVWCEDRIGRQQEAWVGVDAACAGWFLDACRTRITRDVQPCAVRAALLLLGLATARPRRLGRLVLWEVPGTLGPCGRPAGSCVPFSTEPVRLPGFEHPVHVLPARFAPSGRGGKRGGGA